MKKLLSVLVVMSMLITSLSGFVFNASAEDATTLTPAEDGYYYISTAAEFNLISATEAPTLMSNAPGFTVQSCTSTL